MLSFKHMSTTFTPLTFDELKANWLTFREKITAPHPFVLPEWLEAWWESFGGTDTLHLAAVDSDGETIGIAPLRITESTARFIGNADVCDYLDFMVVPGAEAEFFTAVLDDLKNSKVEKLDLESLRPDSTTLKYLVPMAKSHGHSIDVTDSDVTLDMLLPGDWQEYLLSLTTHQRHEIGRKMRRLDEAGTVRFDIMPSENVEKDLSTLIRLLRVSRADKAEFMTGQMEGFFKNVANAMQKAGLLRFGHLRLGETIVASIMCFDYNGTRYLYNSGYDPQYSALSVGLLSKVYSIKDAIEQKMQRYDYLKGAEVYKYHLGGIEMPIMRAVIGLAT